MLANVVYLLLIVAVSPFLILRSVRGGRYRRGLSNKLLGLSAKKSKSYRDIAAAKSHLRWFHAVSVGEVNLLAGLIGSLQPDQAKPYVISTSTDTGYDLAIKLFGNDRVFFCPLDFTWAVQRTFKNLRPSELILMELELWPNLIRAAKNNGCNIYVVNARLSERSAKRYQKFSRFTRPIFASLNWVGCQDTEVLEHFRSCGTAPENLEVTGSLKFDNAPSTRDTPAVLECKTWAGQSDEHLVWLVGSTQPDEEKMALSIFNRLVHRHPNLRLILVPRHPQRFDEVDQLIGAFQNTPLRRSSTKKSQTEWPQDRILLIDTIGELMHWWGTAHLATVGGSFGSRGGQNMLEPAGYGCAVSFGPDTRNFKQIAQTLLQNEAAVRVKDELELQHFIGRCLEDPAYRIRLGKQAADTVNRHRGAVERTCKALDQRSSEVKLSTDR